MLKLTFQPESNESALVKATDEYQLIWDENGTKIIEAMEKIMIMGSATIYDILVCNAQNRTS